MDPALWEIFDGDPDDLTAALVRLYPGAAPPSEIRVVTRFGDVATCRLRRGDVLRVHAHPSVLSLKAPRMIVPEEPVHGLGRGRRPAGDLRRGGRTVAGRGVVVGVVDWGCDVTHPNLLRRDGGTRLLALWDQRPHRGRSPALYGYGVVHSRQAIDRALASDDPFETLGYDPADVDGDGSGTHGTHVLDIAAGRPVVGPGGVAPGADLVFVHMAMHARGPRNLGNSVALLEAVDFIARRAGARPWVINLSMGSHGGPHDGSTLAEQALDAAVEHRGGVIVQSVGNYFRRPVHTAGRLRRGERTRFAWVVDPTDETANELEVWYPGDDRFIVRLIDVEGATIVTATPDSHGPIVHRGRVIGRFAHRTGDPNNGDNHVALTVEPEHARPSLVEIEAIRANRGEYHAWIERDDAWPHSQSRVSPRRAVSTSTTNSISNGHQTITVGAYDAATGGPAFFSSAGPTRDGRAKPDLLASGVRILAARSSPLGDDDRDDEDEDALLTRKSGTSMAAPHVTGTVALLQEAAGRRLLADEVKRILFETAISVSEHRGRSGHGRLDIDAAVAQARRAGAAEGDAGLSLAPEVAKPLNRDDYLYSLGASVGVGGANRVTDVAVLKGRLRELGFDWVPPGAEMDGQTIEVIKLFQSIVSGRESIKADGRIDVPGSGPTSAYMWLQATNAPRWQRLDLGSETDFSPGFFNFEGGHGKSGYATDWLVAVIHGAARRYAADHLSVHPKASRIWINDMSLAHGGDHPGHKGHETGLLADIKLPHKDGTSSGGITWETEKTYDQAATRAMILAFRAENPGITIYFNDPDLAKERVCRCQTAHDNHIHIHIKIPSIARPLLAGETTGPKQAHEAAASEVDTEGGAIDLNRIARAVHDALFFQADPNSGIDEIRVKLAELNRDAATIEGFKYTYRSLYKRDVADDIKSGFITRPWLFDEVTRLLGALEPAATRPRDLHQLVRISAADPFKKKLSDAVVQSFREFAADVKALTDIDIDILEGDTSRALGTSTTKDGADSMSWHKTGRALDLNQDLPWLIVEETVAGATKFRLFLRHRELKTAASAPSIVKFSAGATLHHEIWGKDRDPTWPFVDITRLAEAHGWHRIPAHEGWREHYVRREWWHYERRDGLTMYEALCELFTLETIKTELGKFVTRAKGAARMKREGFPEHFLVNMFPAITKGSLALHAPVGVGTSAANLSADVAAVKRALVAHGALIPDVARGSLDAAIQVALEGFQRKLGIKAGLIEVGGRTHVALGKSPV